MTPEQRKQLEEMAVIAQLSYGQSAGGQRVGARVRSYGVGYRDGAQAAWDMATKAERERIFKVIRECNGFVEARGPEEVLEAILNPAPANEGTEGRES